MDAIDRDRLWTSCFRSLAALAITAGSLTLGIWLRAVLLRAPYFWGNELTRLVRGLLVGSIIGVAGLAAVAGAIWLFRHRRERDAVGRLGHLATRLAPLGPLALVPCLIRARLWQGHDMTFLWFTILVAAACGMTVTAAQQVGPTAFEVRLWRRLESLTIWHRLGALFRNPLFWLWLVVAAAIAYMAYFSYVTVIWHRSVRSGYDLAIQDNVLWNLTHGGPFFKAAPTLGPTGSHFGGHATLIAYLLAPLYAWHQSAETLLVLQSAFLGMAAVPLFLFARRRLGDPGAALVAAVYLFHPAVQQSNLFEVHYVKFGLPFLWTTLWLMDAGRTRLGVAAAVLTLMVREDVATWIILLGAWLMVVGRSPRAGFWLTALGIVYIAVVKFGIMPRLRSGQEELLLMYQGLLPPGKGTFLWVLASVLGNPTYALHGLLETPKLLFLLQVLVPLAVLPLRRPIGWLALLPGLLYCLLATNYGTLVDIHYQYSVHLLAFLLPALVLVFEKERPPHVPVTPRQADARRYGMWFALLVAAIPCAYQYGAVLQRSTSRGGPIPYKFGWDDEGRARRQAIRKVLAVIPPNAAVTASTFTVPQISNRANGYSLSLGLYDAEWLVAPTVAGEYVASELPRTLEALTTGGWGVVAVEGPFFVARRGAAVTRNAAVLAALAR